MMDKAYGGMSVSDGHAQGGGDQGVVILIGHRRADNFARAKIDQRVEVKPAVRALIKATS
jgi:hypothetical protein